jgi:hypothetical protein
MKFSSQAITSVILGSALLISAAHADTSYAADPVRAAKARTPEVCAGIWETRRARYGSTGRGLTLSPSF